MPELVPPHGSQKVLPLLVAEDKRASELERAGSLPKIPLTSREVSDLFMFAMGAYTPLAGFMGEAAWRGVCTDMKLEDGVFWANSNHIISNPGIGRHNCSRRRSRPL